MQLDIRPIAAPAPSNLTAQSGIRAVTLFWNVPVDPDYAKTQIYAHTADNFAAATLVGTVQDVTFRHDVADTTKRYYWIRAVNIYGRNDGSVIGPATGAGTLVAAGDIAPGTVTPAKGIDLQATSNVFPINKAGTPGISSITLTAVAKNLTGDPTWSVSPPGAATLLAGGTNWIKTLSFANMSQDSITVMVSQDGMSDTISISKIREGKDGASGLSAHLSSDSYTTTADKDGVVGSLAGASTTMKIYEGITDVSDQWEFAVSPPSSSSNMQYSRSGGTLTVTNMASAVSVWSVEITASRSGYPSMTKKFTVSKIKVGSNGDPGQRGTVDLTHNNPPNPGMGVAGGWTDAAAELALSSAGYGVPKNRDRVTITGGATGPVSKFYDGTYPNGAWLNIAAWINGNMVVDGTFSAAKISADTMTGQTYQTATEGTRVAINEKEANGVGQIVNNNALKAYIGTKMVVSVGGNYSGMVYADNAGGTVPTIIAKNTSISGDIPGLWGWATENGTGVEGQSNSGVGVRATTVTGNSLVIGGGASSNGIVQTSGGMNWLRNINPASDNAYSLGTSGGYRWTALYANSATITTSDARTKKDVVDSTLGLAFIMDLRPVGYRHVVGENIVTDNWVEIEPATWVTDDFGTAVKTKEAVIENQPIVTPRPGVRQHFGLIAQEVKAALDAHGATDAAIWSRADKDDPESRQALRYEELIAPLIKAMQEQQKQIAALSVEVAELKARTISLQL